MTSLVFEMLMALIFGMLMAFSSGTTWAAERMICQVSTHAASNSLTLPN